MNCIDSGNDTIETPISLVFTGHLASPPVRLPGRFAIQGETICHPDTNLVINDIRKNTCIRTSAIKQDFF